MQKLVKLFVLALCLTVVGSAFAIKVKGPDASLINKNGAVINLMESADPNFELPAVGSRRHGSLDEVVLSEGFEDIEHGSLPEGWMQVDVDGAQNTAEDIWPILFSQWLVFDGTTVAPAIPAHTGVKFASNIYNTTPVVANNDWLILPQQNLTGDITLTFWAASASSNWLESFEVKVSTTDTQPASFTNLISAHPNIPATWTEYTFNLTTYAGAPFYVAIHHTSNDKLLIFLDDVVLEAGEAGPTGTIAGTVTDFDSGDPLSGVDVEIAGGASTMTDANGQYELTEVPVGAYTLNFSKAHYESVTEANVEVTDGNTTTVDAQLVSSAAGMVIIDEDFEDVEAGSLPEGWMQVDVDHGICSDANWPFTGTATEWKVLNGQGFTPHGGVACVANVYNDGGAANNDWLILPQQFLGGSITLTFWSASQQATFPETMAIKVSTTGTAPADFTQTLATYANMPIEWTEHTLDLSEFAGAPFYVAFHHTSVDQWVIKVDDVYLEADTVLSGVNDPVINLPSEFAMNAAYPNPFNPTTRIDFEVPVTTNGELKIFNSLGQEVATLVQGNLNAGVHSVYFDGAALTSGIYFAQLRAGSFVSTQKLVLMK